jgi:hypothetical protein
MGGCYIKDDQMYIKETYSIVNTIRNNILYVSE